MLQWSNPTSKAALQAPTPALRAVQVVPPVDAAAGRCPSGLVGWSCTRDVDSLCEHLCGLVADGAGERKGRLGLPARL